MSEDRKAAILDKVRKLLAKAAGTPFSEEAASLQAKADELMAIYAIEEWELAKKETGEKQKPVTRQMDISWWWDADQIDDALWSLFWACARHSRCVVVYWKALGSAKTVPVVGMDNDLNYMDLLFTDLMLQIVTQLDPTADPNLSYYDNLKRFREAGMSWPDTARKMLVFPHFDPRPNDSSFKVKQDQMTRDYRAWCKKTGTPQNYNHHKTYARNFASGFVATISLRMSEMRKETQGESTPGSSMALAIRDIREEVAGAVTDMFGRPPKGRGLVQDSRKVDYAAMHSGREAGQKARIASNAPGVGGKRKQLDR